MKGKKTDPTMNNGLEQAVYLPSGNMKDELVKDMKRGEFKVCPECGKKFPGGGKRIYCCRKCRDRYYEHHRERRSRSTVARCKWCGKKFLTYHPNRTDRNEGQYCSKSCCSTATLIKYHRGEEEMLRLAEQNWKERGL